MPDIFISYSRRDAAFVRQLRAALDAADKEVWVDLDDIAAGSRWRADIARAIEAANGVVFVVSPDSLVSTECREEARIAREHGKRIVPVVARSANPDAAPAEIAELNWGISFVDSTRFDEELARLVEALDTDLDWTREHTRYQAEAYKWAQSGRDRSFLLRGSELAGAEAWIARQAGKQPPPTELHSELLLASRRAVSRRQRTIVLTLLVSLAIALGLSAFAFLQRDRAIMREKTARARELATAAASNVQEDPALAVTLAATAARTHADPAVLDVLREAFATSGERAVLEADPRWRTLSVAFSPNGKLLASGGSGGGRLWRLSDGRLLRRLGRDTVFYVGFVHGGKDVLTVAERARFWPVNGGRARRGADVSTVIDRAGRVALDSSQLRAVDVSTGKPVARLPLGDRFAISADGRLVASSSSVTPTQVWELKTGRKLLELPNGRATALAFAPEGKRLAVAGPDDAVTIWSIGRRARVAVLRGNESGINSITFSSDGKLVATGGDDGTVRIWDSGNGQPTRVLRGHRAAYREDGSTRAVDDVEFSADGNLVASAGSDGTARVWATWPVPLLERLPSPGAAVNGLDFSPDGRRLGVAYADGAARIWSLAKRRRLALLQADRGPDSSLSGVAFSPDGKLVVTSGPETTLWRSGRRVWTKKPAGYAADAAFSPDGRLIAASGSDLEIRDAASGKRVATVRRGSQHGFLGTDYSADGHLIATAAQNGEVDLRRADGTKIKAFRAHDGPVYDVALSPDGKLLASVGAIDGTVRLWNIRAGKAIATVSAPDRTLKTVDFSADGRYIAFSGSNTKVWELATQRLILTLPGNYVRFAPTGHRLATAVGSEVWLWDCDVCGSANQLLAFAKMRAVRPLTAEERRRYLHKG